MILILLFIDIFILWKWRNDRRTERNLFNCVKKPEKNSGLQLGLNPWPRDYRCDTLQTELWSHWRWEQVNCGFICSRERLKWVLMIYEINHIWRAEMKWKWRNNRFISFPQSIYDLFHISLRDIFILANKFYK